jgi:purine-binding chemotaxis protein CheW
VSSDILQESENSIAKNQYLLFYLKGEIYAIKALSTSEIVEYSHITKVPKMHSYVKGVTNIRGNIVPVVDLLDRFGLGISEIGPKSSIVVINYESEDQVTQLGVIIDEVYEVDDIENSNIRNTPEFGSEIDRKFIVSMGKYRGEYIAILNTQAILNAKELATLSK